jgi:hypothetical protein
MVETTRCPACGTLSAEPVADALEARCAACGAILGPASGDWNPYSAPSAPLKDSIEHDEFAAPITIPRSVFGKFGLAFWLLGSNLALIVPIVLTVWLPLNILITTLESQAPAGQEGMASFRYNSFTGGVFGPIVSGAMIFALSRRIAGVRVTYGRAMQAGFGNWGRLFAANFFAGLFILIGLVALVVPGIILQVRYALLDPAVVLERSPNPRERSTELTAGRRWAIFFSGCLFLGFFLPLSFGVWSLLESLELPEVYWTSIAVESVLDVVGTIGSIVMLLFYCEARQLEKAMALDHPQEEQIDPSRLPDFLRE